MSLVYETKEWALGVAQRKADKLGIVLYVERALAGHGWMVVLLVSDPSTAQAVLPQSEEYVITRQHGA